MKKKILIISYINSHFSSLLPLALKLKRSKKYCPIFLFTKDFLLHPRANESILHCDKLKISVIDEKGCKLFSKTEVKLEKKIEVGAKRKLVDAIKNIKFFYDFCLIFYFLQKFSKELYFANKLLRKIKPKLIVLTEENVLYNTAIYTKTAGKLKIPSLIVPYTIADATELAETCYKENIIQNFPSRLIGFLFPKWIYSYKNKKILLLKYSQIIMMEIFSLQSENPWVINNGFNNALAVESKFMLNYYLKNNLSSKKLFLTGAISDDLIASNNKNLSFKKNQFKRKYHLNNNPVLVCAVPPPQEFRKTDFKNYDDLLNFWIKSLKKIKNFNVVFNLHPNIPSDKLALFEKEKQIVIRSNLSEFIVFADIFIASVSATIRWAIACGIPVLNYDVYRYHYHDYDSVKGVVTVEKKEDFEKVLKKITSNQKYYQKLKEDQEKAAPDWGMLDGRSGERIISLIDELISNAKK